MDHGRTPRPGPTEPQEGSGNSGGLNEHCEDAERCRPGPAHRESGRAAAAGRGMAGASQRGQYRVSGRTVSSPAGIAATHCSQRPELPAASRASASSVSASFRRAATVLWSSRSTSGWPAATRPSGGGRVRPVVGQRQAGDLVQPGLPAGLKHCPPVRGMRHGGPHWGYRRRADEFFSEHYVSCGSRWRASS